MMTCSVIDVHVEDALLEQIPLTSRLVVYERHPDDRRQLKLIILKLFAPSLARS